MVLIACDQFDSSSFCLIACSHPCSTKALSVHTVSTVLNRVSGMIFFGGSPPFYRRIEVAVNTWELFPILFNFHVVAAFSWGRQIKELQVFFIVFFSSVTFILAIQVVQLRAEQQIKGVRAEAPHISVTGHWGVYRYKCVGAACLGLFEDQNLYFLVTLLARLGIRAVMKISPPLGFQYYSSCISYTCETSAKRLLFIL